LKAKLKIFVFKNGQFIGYVFLKKIILFLREKKLFTPMKKHLGFLKKKQFTIVFVKNFGNFVKNVSKNVFQKNIFFKKKENVFCFQKYKVVV
jgi:hypothetical protein